MVKNAPSRSRYEMTFGSNVIWMTSACPVAPEHTCSYVGLGRFPPAYPLTQFSTPFNCLNAASRHQKQPPPKVAISLMRVSKVVLGAWFFVLGEDDSFQEPRTKNEAPLFLLVEIQRARVNAVALARGAGAIGEHVAQVGAALLAVHFDAAHAV